MAMLRLLIAAAAGVVASGKSNIVKLDDGNFNSVITAHDRVLVEFVQADCGLCDGIKRNVEEAANNMKNYGMKSVVAVANTSDSKGMVERFGITGYPTVHYYFKGEKVKEYSGLRDWMRLHDGISKYLEYKENVTSQVTVMKEAHLAPAMGQGEIVFAVKVKKGSVRQKAVWKAADELANYDAFRFRLAVKWMKKGEDPKADAKATLYRPFVKDGPAGDEEDVVFNGKWTSDGIVSWVKKNAFPRIAIEYDSKKQGRWAAEEMGWDAVVVAVLDKEEDEQWESVGNSFNALLHEYPAWKFTMVNKSKLEDLEKKTLYIDKYTESVIVAMKGRRRFVLEGEDAVTDHEQIENFFSGIASGNTRPTFKSEETPKEPVDANGCVKMTGSTFADIALDPEKDVLVVFNTTLSCEKCATLAPEWVKVSKRMKKSGIVVAAIDAIANDCEEDIEGSEFPKIVLYPAVPTKNKLSKKHVYRGELLADPIVEFASENARKVRRDDL